MANSKKFYDDILVDINKQKDVSLYLSGSSYESFLNWENEWDNRKEVANLFEKMVQKIRSLEIRIYQLEKEKRK